ncbi:MAG TPA: metallophosphoesterase [Polyangia bacterium]|jgi:hypothetical protein
MPWRLVIFVVLWHAAVVGFAAAVTGRAPIIGRVPLARGEFFAAVLAASWTVSVAGLWVIAGLGMLLRAAGVVSGRGLLGYRPLFAGLSALVALLAGGLVWARWVEPRRVTVTRQEVALAGLRGRVRVVHLSDTHSDPRFPIEDEVVARVNALAPDVIVFTGDALNRRGRAPAFRAMLAGLRARDAKLAVRGNWDVWYWGGIDLFAGTGFDELTAGWRTLDTAAGPLHVGGHAYTDDARWRELLGTPPAGGPRVFLYHTPDFVPEAAASGLELYLCGHTHAGQVRVPGYGALVTLARHGRRFQGGRYLVGNLVAYVSRGLGVEAGIPLRLGAPPEIACLDLVSAPPPRR